MNFLLLLCVLAISAFSADFEKSNLRAQVYVDVVPYYPIAFDATGASSLSKQNTLPLSGGVLFSPLITPAYKFDLPFTVWLGVEAGNWSFTNLYTNDSLAKTHNEQLAWSEWSPAVTGAISYNLIGDLDLRLLGGVGLTRTSFTHTITDHPEVLTYTDLNYFGTVSLEYVLVKDIMHGCDLKMSAFYRQDALDVKNRVAVPLNSDPYTSATQTFNNLTSTRIEQNKPKFGVEFSLDFGREPRADRKTRFQLRDRDQELRKHNAANDTLTEWDCMAIERDYKFFIAANGELPDMKEKYTKSQFTDVLESFLAFCKPEDLQTKEQLYSTLDSNKVQLKQYQLTQEDTRYKQVIASNDVSYLKMFLQYYPHSRYRTAIESKVALLDDYGAFRTARTGNTYKDYLQYLANFPEGQYRKEAETGIYALVQSANRQKDYEIYLKKFPDGVYVNEARRALHEIMKQE